ncbi:Flap endonuclease Xni [Vibrio stylophorae]|uniref:Flap endonuclease Xni n=1 Tax=Vibrio stylophorae TaxID=659351 RepID=A0ABM8ZV96_9VIBR|nr:flap endonuclease Xni [Vibrio stylophorae]CAH0534252.1 Flap endonuclease Xni [Vibrio stylophorae]
MAAIHLVIIDALNLIRRIHAVHQSDDIEQTMRVCQQALHKIIAQSEPSHIIAVFDQLNPSDRGWRAEVLPDYKAGRKPMPEALLEGMDRIQDALWQCGVDSLLSDGDEADDLIATLACKLASRGEQVTIISTDKGYCQLLQPTLRIRDYFQQRWLDIPFIEKEYGVKATQLTDYWGLAGISSSQIPGIPGIGPKAAQTLLAQYGDLETILNATDLPARYQNKVSEFAEQARRCQQVSRLKTDIPLGFNLRDIRYQAAPE